MKVLLVWTMSLALAGQAPTAPAGVFDGKATGVRIVGRVTGPLDRVPRPRTMILTGTSPGGPSDRRETTLADSGRFEFSQVPPGTYTLAVSGTVPSLVSPRTLVVASRDLTGIEMAIPIPIEIRGQVVVDGVQELTDIEGILVHAQRPDSTVAVPVRRGGAFTLATTTGRQWITVRGIPMGYVLKAMTFRSRALNDGVLELHGSDSRGVLQIVLGRAR